MTLISWYRRHWSDVGIVGSAALAGLLAWRSTGMDRSRALSMANLAALGAHQFEEHSYPGYFAGHFNTLRGSAQPWRYPGNAQSGLLVNTMFAYPFYVAPVLLPRQKWIGLATSVFGFSQIAGHGIAFPLRAKEYSPGAVTALLLHGPIGAAWIREQRQRGGFSKTDIAKTVALIAGFIAIGVITPQRLYLDENSPYPIALKQVRPVDRAAAEAAGIS